MTIKDVNFEDLYQTHCKATGALLASLTLEALRRDPSLQGNWKSFPLPSDIQRSAAIIFSPIGDLLRFYSLLEIALLITFIPEPSYSDPFWQEATRILSLPLIKDYGDNGYPVLLPQFLLGRLEGRLHLEEESLSGRYSDVCAIFVSFSALVSRWKDPDVESFLRFVLSTDTDQLQWDAIMFVLRDKVEFISRILSSSSIRGTFGDQLFHGFSKSLAICEDLDYLLESARKFPLLQSAMWNCHADLFWILGGRFTNRVLQMVLSFDEWTKGEDEKSDRTEAVKKYISDVRELFGRLSSGSYGGALNSQMLLSPSLVGA